VISGRKTATSDFQVSFEVNFTPLKKFCRDWNKWSDGARSGL